MGSYFQIILCGGATGLFLLQTGVDEGFEAGDFGIFRAGLGLRGGGADGAGDFDEVAGTGEAGEAGADFGADLTLGLEAAEVGRVAAEHGFRSHAGEFEGETGGLVELGFVDTAEVAETPAGVEDLGGVEDFEHADGLEFGFEGLEEFGEGGVGDEGGELLAVGG